MKKIVFALLLIAVFGGIQVVSANGEAPVAEYDNYIFCWDTGNPFGYVLENDYDPNDLPLTVELLSEPTHGVVNFESGGIFCYGPDWYFLGEDSFTYRIFNGYEYSEPASVTILMLVSTGRIPTAREDAFTISAGTTLEVPAPGILGNDEPYPGSGFSIDAVLIQSPEHGNLSLNSDGSFSYTPETGFVGTDRFLYVAENENNPFWFSDYTPVTITVHEPGTPVPEFPGMFVVIGGIILGTAFIAQRMRIHR